MVAIARQVGISGVGPGIIRFYWKVSSQLGGDYVEFFIDSVRQGRISGTTDWQGQSYTITGSGTHTLKWRYTKNGSGTGGSDCAWVDYVQSPSPTDWLTITYGYDAAGRRIEKAYDGQTVCKYLYACPEPAERDGGQIIADYDGNGSLLHKYIYGPGVDQPICMIDVTDGNAVSYYHFDGLGSVVALTNSAGSVVNLYEYSVYGEVSASDPNHPNRFLFTGREFDADTGLYYYRARYYNPYIGRFLQTDPAGDGMNAYAYCHNNPTGRVDPLGEEDCASYDWAICDTCGEPVEGAHFGGVSLSPAPFVDYCALWSGLLPTNWGKTEWYEWTGRYKIASWRTDREEIAAYGSVMSGLNKARVVDTGLGISKVVWHWKNLNVAGLAEEGIQLVYTTLWSCVESVIWDKLNEMDFGYPYRAYIEVNVYQKRTGFWAKALGSWKKTGKRWVEIKCGRGYQGGQHGSPGWYGYENKVQAMEAIREALDNLPVRPGEHLDRQFR